MADTFLPKDHWTIRAERISKGLTPYTKRGEESTAEVVPQDDDLEDLIEFELEDIDVHS